jgi:hypothetical protein
MACDGRQQKSIYAISKPLRMEMLTANPPEMVQKRPLGASFGLQLIANGHA